MLDIIRSHERGLANFGWLNSKHTFSFGSYYNPKQMGFSTLRVINDDQVAAGAGFETHGHRNMEIISYVLEGEIAHKDSTGNAEIIPAGEFQLMSAGSGIYHSEFNASTTEALKFLQIWIEPNQLNGAPDYQQKRFERKPGLTEVITADGRNATLRIKQDMSLSQLLLTPEQTLTLPAQASRHYYLHLIAGELLLNGLAVSPGDGVKISHETQLKVQALSDDVDALWFDLPSQ